MTMAFLTALVELAREVIEIATNNGTDPLDELNALRAGLRKGIEVSTQAELDAKFGKRS